MIQITVAFGASVCPLLFKDKAGADAAWVCISDRAMLPQQAVLNLEDEFGRKLHLPFGLAAGAIYEDLDQSKLAQIEISLHQARTQVEANKRGMHDPVLQGAQRLQTGPAMLSPMGNGRYPS